MAVLAAFRRVYESAYGVAQGGPAEFVTYRVRAICPFAPAGLAGRTRAADRDPTASCHAGRTRRATFSASPDSSTFPVLSARRSRPRRRAVTGRRFVEGPESTTLLPPGALLTVDTLGTMHLWPEGKDLA